MRAAALAALCLPAACNGPPSTDPRSAEPPAAESAAAPAPAAPTTAPAPAAPAPTAAAAPTAAPAPAAPPTASAPAAAGFDRAPQSDPHFPSSSAQLLPVGVRIGAHDGFERVVFELEGKGAPGWHVEYVGAAIEDGSGEPVKLAGSHFLQLTITGVRYPEDEAEAARIPHGTQRAAATHLIREVAVRTLFEAQLQAFIGLATKAPFRVRALQDPPRLVVDVQTAAK